MKIKSDDVIKAKHKECDDEIRAALETKNGSGFSPEVQRLRQLYQNRKPTLERPYGS